MDPVDLVRHILALFFEGALCALLLLRGSAEVGLALGPHPVALDLLLLLEVLVDLLGCLLSELLDGEWFGLRHFLHPFLFLIGFGEVAAVHHVELLLRNAFFGQLAVGLLRVATDVGVLLLQRRDGALAEVHAGRGRRGSFGRNCLGRMLGRGGSRRLPHLAKRGGHGVLVRLYHFHHVGAHVLGLLVALEVVDVFNAAWDVLLQRFLQLLLGFELVDRRRLTAAYSVHLPSVAFRLAVG